MSNFRPVTFGNINPCDNTALDELSKFGDLIINLSQRWDDQVAWLPCDGVDIVVDTDRTEICSTGTIDGQLMALRIVERLVNVVDGSNPGADFVTRSRASEIIRRLDRLSSLIDATRKGYADLFPGH